MQLHVIQCENTPDAGGFALFLFLCVAVLLHVHRKYSGGKFFDISKAGLLESSWILVRGFLATILAFYVAYGAASLRHKAMGSKCIYGDPMPNQIDGDRAAFFLSVVRIAGCLLYVLFQFVDETMMDWVRTFHPKKKVTYARRKMN